MDDVMRKRRADGPVNSLSCLGSWVLRRYRQPNADQPLMMSVRVAAEGQVAPPKSCPDRPREWGSAQECLA